MKIKYLENGNEVQVIEEIKLGGYLVAQIYNTDYGDHVSTQFFFVDHIFDKPITPKCDKRIIEIQNNILKLEITLKERQLEISKVEKEFENLISKDEEVKYLKQ